MILPPHSYWTVVMTQWKLAGQISCPYILEASSIASHSHRRQRLQHSRNAEQTTGLDVAKTRNARVIICYETLLGRYADKVAFWWKRMRSVVGSSEWHNWRTEGYKDVTRSHRKSLPTEVHSVTMSVSYCRLAGWLTLRSWALLERSPIVQPIKNFPACYRTRGSITVSTCPYPEPDQSIPHRSILSLQDPS
jgi:hypothetical protein